MNLSEIRKRHEQLESGRDVEVDRGWLPEAIQAHIDRGVLLAALPVREAPREHIVRQDYDSSTVSGSPTTGSEPQKEQVMNDSALDINDMIKSGSQPLPCPLCAGPAYAFWSVNGEQMFKVGCPPCGLELKAAWYRGTDKPTKDILTLWNTRPKLTTGSEPPQDRWDIAAIVREVAELPDRTSPDDWPEAMLVTADELTAILTAAQNLPTGSEPTPPEPKEPDVVPLDDPTVPSSLVPIPKQE